MAVETQVATAVEGRSGKELLREVEEKYRKYYNPSLVRLLKFGGYGALEWRGEGTRVFDVDGKPYLDFAGGYGVFNLGHRHPRVVEAVKAQLELMPLSAKMFFNKPMADLAERLAQITPEGLQYSFFCNSGTESVEGALKLARLAMGKPGIVATFNSFHGKTFGSLSASGRDLFKTPFEPLLPAVSHVPFGDAEAIEAAIVEMGGNAAAVILEPIQGEGGIVVPADDYLPKVAEICKRHDVLLIVDEVQSGLARSGKMWAVEHWDTKPDILLMAKALGGGVMPMGALIGTPRVWQPLGPNPLIHTSTFGGSPMACAAGLAAIEVIEEERLAERATEMGYLLMQGLEDVRKRHPQVVKEVRGKGLMVGVELAEERFGGIIMLEMAHRGVIGVYTLNMPRVMRFEPPLIVTTSEVDQAVAAFEGAVRRARDMFKV
ncbi:MAG: aspartate aminotransferase family protein [Armatimonadetes bacterium]|nr:aspartate aminotransferase family protein [Armatimonadota bacterium]